MLPDEGVGVTGRTLGSEAWRSLRKNKRAVLAIGWIGFVAFVAVTAGLWAPNVLGDPTFVKSDTVVQEMLLPPSAEHLLGTDQLGRDVLCRVVYGARVSLLVGVVAVVMMLSLGMVLGGCAGYHGGWWDVLLMRTVDVFCAFPYLLLAIVLLAVMGPGIMGVCVTIGILGWPSVARVLRASVLSVKENEYVHAARATGASSWWIISRHVIPNALGPVTVLASLGVGGAILGEAALSFLGIGIPLGEASWGNMLAEARVYVTVAPWMMLFPGLATTTTVLAFVLLGDALRDALDPRSAR
jgi:peptide/nickel transport system permease protein